MDINERLKLLEEISKQIDELKKILKKDIKEILTDIEKLERLFY